MFNLAHTFPKQFLIYFITYFTNLSWDKLSFFPSAFLTVFSFCWEFIFLSLDIMSLCFFLLDMELVEKSVGAPFLDPRFTAVDELHVGEGEVSHLAVELPLPLPVDGHLGHLHDVPDL